MAKLSKKNEEVERMSQAYGCLGSVYGQLHNHGLALEYHLQHVNMARAQGNNLVLINAYELLGDTQFLLKDFESAEQSYTKMYDFTKKQKQEMQATSLIKLGRACYMQGRYQYAAFYFRRALDIAEQLKLKPMRIICNFSLARCWQHSTQYGEMEQGRTLFSQLIPLLEGKIQQHRQEGTFCSEELRQQLEDGYEGIVDLLLRVGSPVDCLQYTEAKYRKHVLRLQPQPAGPTGHLFNIIAAKEIWMAEYHRCVRMVNQYSVACVCYRVFRDTILIWVLRPGQDAVKFHVAKSQRKLKMTNSELVIKLIHEIKMGRDERSLLYDMDHRTLPRKDDLLKKEKNNNERLSKTNKILERRKQLIKDFDDSKSVETQDEKPKKSAEKQLFDVLLAPVYDSLMVLPENSPIIFLPCQEFYQCPFEVMTDWNNQKLGQRFRITVLPNLFTFEKVNQNEMMFLQEEDSRNFERMKCRLGGIPKIIQNIDFNRLSMPDTVEVGMRDSRQTVYPQDLNLKRVSNPRLVTASLMAKQAESEVNILKIGGLSRENTNMVSLMSIPEYPTSARSHGNQSRGNTGKAVTFGTSSISSVSKTKTGQTGSKLGTGAVSTGELTNT